MDIKKHLKKNLPGIIIGVLFTSFFSLIVWLFAYFGYIDLRLPQRFDFQKLDRLIRETIPSDYNYKISEVNFRNVKNSSLIVQAVHRDLYTSFESVPSDILLVYDRTDTGYRKSYIFQPEGNQHIREGYFVDLNNDNARELVFGWSMLGANFSPPLATVFESSTDGSVEVLGFPRLSNYDYGGSYQVPVLTSIDQNIQVRSGFFYSIFAKENEIAVINRTDNACNACQEEHIYGVNYFTLFEKELVENKPPETNVNGRKKLDELLESKGFQVD